MTTPLPNKKIGEQIVIKLLKKNNSLRFSCGNRILGINSIKSQNKNFKDLKKKNHFKGKNSFVHVHLSFIKRTYVSDDQFFLLHVLI